MRISIIALLFLISLYPNTISAQHTLSPFIHVESGMRCSEDFANGIGVNIEGGIQYKGLEMALSFLIYTDNLRNSGSQSISVQKDPDVFFDSTLKNYSDLRNTSVSLRIGYDLLSWLPHTCRHHFTPFIGTGWTSIFQTNVIHEGVMSQEEEGNKRYGSLINIDKRSDMDFYIGGTYAYALTDNWRLTLSYAYWNRMERDLISVGCSYIF